MSGFLQNPLLAISALLGLALLANIVAPYHVAVSRYVALTASVIALFLGLVLCLAFDKSATGFQFTSEPVFLPEYNLSFSLGADGLSVVFLLLTLFIFPILFLSA